MCLYSVRSDYLGFPCFCFWSYPFWREVGKRQGMVGNLQASHLIIRICTKGITSDLVFHMNLFGAERFKRKPKLQNRQNLGNPRYSFRDDIPGNRGNGANKLERESVWDQLLRGHLPIGLMPKQNEVKLGCSEWTLNSGRASVLRAEIRPKEGFCGWVCQCSQQTHNSPLFYWKYFRSVSRNLCHLWSC